MSVEKGQNVLLQVGDGGEAEVTGTIYSVDGETSIVGGRVNRSSGSFISDEFAVGQVVHVAGFTTNPSVFHGIAVQVSALSILLDEVVDADGNPAVLVDEAAGDTVTVTGETFSTFKGQDDTQMAIAMGEIDASTKDTGKWGASLSGTARMTITCNGKVNWPDATGVQKIHDAMNDNASDVLKWLKLIQNTAGDFWFGQFSVTQCNLGGAKDGATTYTVGFSNKTRPRNVLVAGIG